MAFSWTDYLTLAKNLANASDEASYRSAVSRAYYAAFGTAWEKLAYAQQRAIRDSGREKHQQTWAIYGEEMSMSGENIGDNGLALRDLRGTADYDGRGVVTAGDAQIAISQAQNLIEDILNT